jgi:hypothetical protein
MQAVHDVSAVVLQATVRWPATQVEAEQVVQAGAAAADHVPAAQLMQEDAPAPDQVPAAQSTHEGALQ